MPDYDTCVNYILSSLEEFKNDPEEFKNVNVTALAITKDTDLIRDLGLSSLKVLELVERLEDHFDLSIPLNILPDVNTANELARKIIELKDH